jgi:hypothetical protein
MFLNMKLLAQHTLNGFGGMGEGMSMQLARDGRRAQGDRADRPAACADALELARGGG